MAQARETGATLQRADWMMDLALNLVPQDKVQAQEIVPAVFKHDTEGDFIQAMAANRENSNCTYRAVIFGDLLTEGASGLYTEQKDAQRSTYTVHCHYERCDSILDVPRVLATRAMEEVDLFIFRMFHSEFCHLTEREWWALDRPLENDNLPAIRSKWLRWLAYKYLAVVRWVCDQYGNSRGACNDSDPPCSIILLWPTQGDAAKYNKQAWSMLSRDKWTLGLSRVNQDFYIYKQDFKLIWNAISPIPLVSEFTIFQECYGRIARELEYTAATFSATAGVIEDYRPIWDPVKPFLDRGLILTRAGVGRLLRGSAHINKKGFNRKPRMGTQCARPYDNVLNAVEIYDAELKTEIKGLSQQARESIPWEAIQQNTFDISIKLSEVNNIVEYQKSLKRHGFKLPEMDLATVEQVGLEYPVEFDKDQPQRDQEIQQRGRNSGSAGETERTLQSYAYAPPGDWRGCQLSAPPKAHVSNPIVPDTQHGDFPFQPHCGPTWSSRSAERTERSREVSDRVTHASTSGVTFRKKRRRAR